MSHMESLSGMAGGGIDKAGTPAEDRGIYNILGFDFSNFLGLISLGSLGYAEFNLIPFIQGPETFSLNSGMVHENIIPGIAPDETVAFFVIEPLNYALFFHFPSSSHCFNTFASLLRLITFVCFRSIL